MAAEYGNINFYDRNDAEVEYNNDAIDYGAWTTLPLTGKLLEDAGKKYGAYYIQEYKEFWGTSGCCSGGFEKFSLLDENKEIVAYFNTLPELIADLA